MGGGGFSGDTSVDWDVHGEHVRRHSSEPKGQKGRQQGGIDETPDGVQYFTIAIKLPKSAGERNAFVQALRDEVANAKDSIRLQLPIEDDEHGGPTLNQIRVDWPSRPTQPGV